MPQPRAKVVKSNRRHRMSTEHPNELAYGHRMKPATVKMLQGQPPRVRQVADRWASTSLTKFKALESHGKLLDALKAQAKLEGNVISDARVGGAMSDVPDHEILALNEIDPGPDSVDVPA